MQEYDKRIVERYLDELFSRGDVSKVDELVSQDFVSHTYPAGEGREHMREMVVNFQADYPGVTIVVDEVIMLGNRAFVTSYVLASDGKIVGEAGISDILVFDIENGLITDRWFFVPPQ